MATKSVVEEKQTLRAEMLAQRAALPQEQVAQASSAIVRRMKSLAEFQRARCIHCYVAWRNEVSTEALITGLLEQRRRVVVPVVDLKTRSLTHSEICAFSDLSAGTYGILEPAHDLIRPVNTSELDLIIVPGVAFDVEGNRLGFGGGFYDAFLSQTKAFKIGLCYEFQILERLPVEPRDQKVDLIVSETRAVRVH